MRDAGASSVGLLGYCMGGTLAAIHTALEPRTIAALVNLAGPVDFSHGGQLAHMTDARWFDPAAMVAAGNLGRFQMQSGFVALRPMAQLAKWVGFADRMFDAEKRDEFFVVETWANDNIDFPGAAYHRYIEDLYQNNELVRGEHRIAGRRVDLGKIECPVLVVTAEKDHICPPAAAQALVRHVASTDTRLFESAGGHVGCVVGHLARTELYPALAGWLHERLGSPRSPALAEAPSAGTAPRQENDHHETR
jgi:polyhydroxyalkanoate synthase subunit PhaC